MSYIIWNRKCRKCGGQLTFEEAEDGYYLNCIQCAAYEKVNESEVPTFLAAQSRNSKKTLAKTGH
jgi:hypothetical protein